MKNIFIGRGTNNQIIVNEDFVSRRHAELIVLDNGQVMLKDLGSSNGTFVNGNKITESYLRTGDIVKCANTVLNWQQYTNPVKPDPDRYQSFQPQVEPGPQPGSLSQQPKLQSQQLPAHVYGQQNVIIIGKQKSVGVAFLLAFLFGPMGLLYASIIGGIVMFFISLILFFILPIVGIIIGWVGCIIWAVVAANNANSNMINRAAPLIQNN